MKRLPKLVVIAVLALFLSAATARADFMNGTIMDVFPDQFQVVVADPEGNMHTFIMDEDFTILVNDLPAVLEDLQTGDRVEVVFRMEEADMLAIEIHCRR
jgi:hypothetical protein